MYIVVDDAKILQMRIAIAKRTVKRDQHKELFRVFVYARGVRELSEALHDPRVFQELRLIERWGSGIPRMSAACDDAGLPTPKLEEIGSHFRVTIYCNRAGAVRVDTTDRKLLNSLNDHGAMGATAIAKLLGLSNRATLSRLSALKSRGLVVEIGTGRQDPKRQYSLPK